MLLLGRTVSGARGLVSRVDDLIIEEKDVVIRDSLRGAFKRMRM